MAANATRVDLDHFDFCFRELDHDHRRIIALGAIGGGRGGALYSRGDRLANWRLDAAENVAADRRAAGGDDSATGSAGSIAHAQVAADRGGGKQPIARPPACAARPRRKCFGNSRTKIARRAGVQRD